MYKKVGPFHQEICVFYTYLGVILISLKKKKTIYKQNLYTDKKAMVFVRHDKNPKQEMVWKTEINCHKESKCDICSE